MKNMKIYILGEKGKAKVETIPGESDPLGKGLDAKPTPKDVTATL